MEMINVPPTVMAQLLQNAEDHALAMTATAAPEQIEMAQRQNYLFDRGLEIYPDSNRESRRDSEICEFCSKDKLPF